MSLFWPSVAGALAVVTLLLFWRLISAERKAAAAIAEAQRKVAEDDAKSARMDNKAVIEGVAKVQAIEADRPLTVRDAARRLREMRDE